MMEGILKKFLNHLCVIILNLAEEHTAARIMNQESI